MGIEYKRVDWVFNTALFCAVLRDAIGEGEAESWAELLEVHENTIQRWRRGQWLNRNFPYPNMTNLLKICNALDLDPRDFFETGD